MIERRASEPLVRLSIFSVRTVRGANVAMFLVACGLFAMFFFNTLYLQRVLDYSALEGGLAFLPFTLGIIIGAGLSQKLLPALGAREVPLIGLAMAIAGLLLFLRLTPDGTYLVDFLPGLMLTSIGMGLTFVPVTLIATQWDPRRRRGPRLRTLQHVATGRRRAGAGGAVDHRDGQDDGRDRVARAEAHRGRYGERARRRLPRRLDRERGAPRSRGGAAPVAVASP